MIQFACPACQKGYKVSDDLSGRRTKCRACGQEIRVPEATPLEAEHELYQFLPWARWLAECQERLGDAPREFNTKTIEYLGVDGGWIDSLFSLLFFFEPLCRRLNDSRQRLIFQRGQVVWGHIIQANGELWGPIEPGADADWHNRPGELVFSNDDSGRVTPEFLEPIAERIGGLRGDDHDDPELDKIGNYLEAQTVRAFGWDVPKQLSPRVPCFISTTMFTRRHLPDGYLQRPFLPIVISHAPPYFAIPLPERFWPTEFRDWWRGDEE